MMLVYHLVVVVHTLQLFDNIIVWRVVCGCSLSNVPRFPVTDCLDNMTYFLII